MVPVWAAWVAWASMVGPCSCPAAAAVGPPALAAGFTCACAQGAQGAWRNLQQDLHSVRCCAGAGAGVRVLQPLTTCAVQRRSV